MLTKVTKAIHYICKLCNDPVGQTGLKLIGLGGLLVIFSSWFNDESQYVQEPITIQVEDYEIVDE